MRLQNSREASAPVPDRCWLQTLPDDYGTGLLQQTVPAAGCWSFSPCADTAGAKFQILRLPTVRAGHIKTHEMRRLVGRFFDLAGAFYFRRRAANGFWPYRALNTLIPQQGWRALFFDIRLERGKFVIADHVHGFFTVVFCCRTTQAPEAHPR